MSLSGAAGNGFHYDFQSDKGKKKGLFVECIPSGGDVNLPRYSLVL